MALLTIPTHTTASAPRPHIVYNIALGGTTTVVPRRYSEFVALHAALGDAHTLPPRRLLVTAFLPSAWADDRLIAERKVGLAAYLAALLADPAHRDAPALRAFLAPAPAGAGAVLDGDKFSLEDALPSTLSRADALAAQAALATEPTAAAAALPIAAAYWPDWAADTNPPESIVFGKFDIIFYAFATPNGSSTLSWDSGGQGLLQRLVSAAKSSGKGTKVVLSVGGWGGSYYFSQAMGSSGNRTTFINALSSAVNTYGLDGIDIDWEYPNNPGAGNPYSANDAANFLTFLTALRSKLGSSKIISAAVTDLPWLGSNGSPLTNVSAYAAQMSYVNIMNYDIWGASSKPGPNAPLNNGCGTSTQPQYSAQAALTQWTKAGFPAAKLLLGLPLYGYVSKSTATGLSGSLLPGERAAAAQGPGAHAHARPVVAGEKARAAAAAGDLSGWWGQQIAFNALLASGALKKNSDGTYTGANGYTMDWDNCSDTPFLYNKARTTVVTYDDTYSLADKAALAKSGMGGVFTWSLDQDDGVALQDAIRTALGRPPPS